MGEIKLFDKTIFDLFDYTTTTLMLPLSGILITIFIGWKVKRSLFVDELTNHGTIKSSIVTFILFVLRYIAPFALVITFLNGLGLLDF